MNTTTNSGGIFTFNHDYKKLNKAIGVEPEYLDELGTQVTAIIKNFIFDDDKGSLRDDMSPSELVEACATEFSYSQLVILASFYLQDKIDGFGKHVEKKLKNLSASVKSIALDIDDVPDNIREILEGLTEGKSRATAIDGDTLPPELKDFLQKLAEEQERDGDDD